MAFFDDLLRSITDQPSLLQGISIVDIPTLQEPLRGVVNSLNRGGPVTPAQFAARWSLDETQTVEVLHALLERGLLRMHDRDGQNVYEVRLGWREGRELLTAL